MFVTRGARKKKPPQKKVTVTMESWGTTGLILAVFPTDFRSKERVATHCECVA